MNVFAVILNNNSGSYAAVTTILGAPAIAYGSVFHDKCPKLRIRSLSFYGAALIGVGRVCRSLATKVELAGGFNGLDRLVLLWGIWLLFSSLFHQPMFDALVFRMGIVFNFLGIYFLIRLFCRDTDD